MTNHTIHILLPADYELQAEFLESFLTNVEEDQHRGRTRLGVRDVTGPGSEVLRRLALRFQWELIFASADGNDRELKERLLARGSSGSDYLYLNGVAGRPGPDLIRTAHTNLQENGLVGTDSGELLSTGEFKLGLGDVELAVPDPIPHLITDDWWYCRHEIMVIARRMPRALAIEKRLLIASLALTGRPHYLSSGLRPYSPEKAESAVAPGAGKPEKIKLIVSERALNSRLTDAFVIALEIESELRRLELEADIELADSVCSSDPDDSAAYILVGNPGDRVSDIFARLTKVPIIYWSLGETTSRVLDELERRSSRTIFASSSERECQAPRISEYSPHVLYPAAARSRPDPGQLRVGAVHIGDAESFEDFHLSIMLDAASETGLKIYGSGWEATRWASCAMGLPGLDDGANAFANASHAIVIPTRSEFANGHINRRYFQALAAGCHVIAPESADLRKAFGEKLIYTSSAADTRHFLRSGHISRGSDAVKWVLEHHTYGHRAAALLSFFTSRRK